MKLLFLGTRGGIKARSKEHYRHASLLIKQGSERIMIDCGGDWLTHLTTLKPTAIVITHAHPDHVNGLKNGAPCPVYATADTYDRIKRYPLAEKIVVIPNNTFALGSLILTPFSVEHSLNAPAVGYRIAHNNKILFYAPDLVSIVNKEEALRNVALYIGDGAIITRRLLIRKRNNEHIGHAPIAEQLAWCQQARIPRALITHCGTEIVTGNPEFIEEELAFLRVTYRVTVAVAYDGMVIKHF